MKYLKIDTDFSENMESLGDAERGRLFTAMLAYAKDGTVADLRGSERILWGTVKKAIDEQRKSYDALCQRNLRNATSRYQSHPVATSGSQWEDNNIDIYIPTTSRETSNSNTQVTKDSTLKRDSSNSTTTFIENNQVTKGSTQDRDSSNITVLNSFDTFWLAYPKKVAKKDAQRAWMKIKPSQELLTTMLEAIEQQKQSKTWREGYVPNPATWLNGERWNDVVKPTDRLAHLREMYEQEVAKDDSTGYGSDVCGHSNAVSPGNNFFDFIKTDG